MTTKEIQEWLIAQLAQLLDVDPDRVDVQESFSSYGLSSLDIVTLSGDLEEFLEQRLSPTLAYDHPSIAALAQHLGEKESDLEPAVA
ncbi:MAG: acyl carrier protein, partial [Phaeodactylibacter sp.]|nr:acyl carrier protein [Phaeodactylibacter sp.]